LGESFTDFSSPLRLKRTASGRRSVSIFSGGILIIVLCSQILVLGSHYFSVAISAILWLSSVLAPAYCEDIPLSNLIHCVFPFNYLLLLPTVSNFLDQVPTDFFAQLRSLILSRPYFLVLILAEPFFLEMGGVL